MLAGVGQLLDARFGKLSGQVTGMLAKYDEGIHMQFRAHETQVRELAERLDPLAQSSADTRRSVVQIAEVLATVEASTP